jgi:glutamate dehydrogenase
LSAQAQEMLGLHTDKADPELVIRHILSMEVDLLWNGGIGTYVKAATQTHTDADDRSNDRVRVDGNELRCAIAGEGGNLGFTQRGRIEAALNGVRLNTDAIDNSGGVDMSDHEVNLKILLNGLVTSSHLTRQQRNDLLRDMTDEVRDLVLANNDAHGRQLSRDQVRSQQDIFPFLRAIDFVEQQLDRTRESLRLPSDEELMNRAENQIGLTRPELAVLSAHVKMYVYTELLANQPKTLPGYSRFLHSYFPEVIQERYPGQIDSHLLADEIAMTVATTRLIADAGAAFIPMTVESSGRSVFEIAAAYFSAQHLARTDLVRSTLEAARASADLSVLYRAWVMVDAGAREVTAYWLSPHGRVPTADQLQEMSEAVDQVFDLNAGAVRRRDLDQVAQLSEQGIPESVGELVLKAKYLNIGLMVWGHTRATGASYADMVIRQLAVGRASRVQELIDGLASRPATGRWEPIAMRTLHNRFMQLLRRLVRETQIEGPVSSVDALEAELTSGALSEVRQQVDEIIGEDGESPSVATLLVLEERVSSVISRMSS